LYKIYAPTVLVSLSIFIILPYTENNSKLTNVFTNWIFKLNNFQIFNSNLANDVLGFNDNTQFTKVGINALSLKVSDAGGIRNQTYQSSAVFEAESTTKGFLPPRMTTTQINAIATPANGLTVYNTTLSTLCFFNGTIWQRVISTAM